LTTVPSGNKNGVYRMLHPLSNLHAWEFLLTLCGPLALVCGGCGGLGVPTLVLHRAGNRFIRPARRYLAEHIPTTRYVKLPGAEHYYYLGDVESLASEIEEFLTRALNPAGRSGTRSVEAPGL